MPGRKRDPINTPAPTDDAAQQHSANEDEKTLQGQHGESYANRSVRSLEKGGQNEQQGEPAPGYGTVTPGQQEAGQKR